MAAYKKDIFLLLGSNLDDPVSQLHMARIQAAEKLGIVVTNSSVFRTAPWGNTDQPDFLNQALQLATSLAPADLMQACLGIEHALGRIRSERWAARRIDIDVLFYGSEIIHAPTLEIPHPRLQDRRFALAPLAEIAPDFVHPVLRRTVRELLNACPDRSAVHRL